MKRGGKARAVEEEEEEEEEERRRVESISKTVMTMKITLCRRLG